jgi:anti-anti-sigma regulatory factor
MSDKIYTISVITLIKELNHLESEIQEWRLEIAAKTNQKKVIIQLLDQTVFEEIKSIRNQLYALLSVESSSETRSASL